MSLILLGILNSQAAAAGGAAAYDLLETTVLSSDASGVTFTGLDSYSDYKHLQIRAVIRGTTNTVTEGVLQLNGVTSGYATHMLNGYGSGINAQNSVGSTYMWIGMFPGSGVTSGAFGATVIDILDFSNTNKNTTIRALGGSADNAIRLTSGAYFSTSAVTSLFVGWRSNGDNALAGSRFSIYGVR